MTYDLNRKGLFVGFLMLTFLPPLPMIIFMIVMVSLYTPGSAGLSFPAIVTIAMATQFIFSALATLICFAPVWFVMHKLRWRKRWQAFVSASLAFAVAMVLMAIPQLNEMKAGHLEQSSYSALLSMVLPLIVQSVLYGAVAAFLAWQRAYRAVDIGSA